MKRNKNLIELSRDHHQGLLLGWKIKQGFKKDIPVNEITEYAIYFANEALFTHFDEEENQILIFLKEDDALRRRTIVEHAEIREIIRLIANPETATRTLLLELAEKLEAHIRFEERELFPYIEKILPEQQLEEIGRLIAEVHHPYIESYPNVFWTN